jgi:hypothetical protein
MSREIESSPGWGGNCDSSDRCDLIGLKLLVTNDDAGRVVIVEPKQFDGRVFINPPRAV